MRADASIHAFASGRKIAGHKQKGADPRSREGDAVCNGVLIAF
jgi:hypothetical protein